MADLGDRDFTNLSETPLNTGGPLSYGGSREVLLNQQITLKGSYDPQRITKVSLVAEDRFPFTVTLIPSTQTWQVPLTNGFQSPGLRWLRLKGLDAAGNTVSDYIVYLTVSNNPLTIGKLTLKVLQDTYFKVSSADSGTLSDRQKVFVKAGRTFEVQRYGYVDAHLKVELSEDLEPLGNFGFVYEDFVELRKGSQVLVFNVEDLPTTNLNAQLLITQTTVLKASLADSSTLPADKKMTLIQGMVEPISGYACVNGHFRITLGQAIEGFASDMGYIYWQHGIIKHGDKIVNFEPDALTVSAVQTTIFKKRPVDSVQLKPNEKTTFHAGEFYGVSSYATELGHIKLALTEELPQFGNTGYVFPGYVQLKRGGRLFNPYPPQVELNVPYFSQRDNPRYPWSTCNVTSIAMALYYYGRRSQWSQLEDELLQWCFNRYGEGCQTNNYVLSEMIQAYGFKTSFSMTRKWVDIRDELISRRPVVLGGDFTASGHILCVIGYTSQGYLVNDPWGDALTGYTNTEGRRLLYPYSYMDRVAGPNGKIWAHFISK
jgi:hypothetical protein